MFFAPAFRPSSEIAIWGPAAPEASLRGPDRALHLRAAVAGRGARAAVRRLVPRRARGRVGDRPGDDPRRLGHPPRARRSATGSPRATSRSVTSPTTSRRSARDLDELEPEWISGFDLARDAVAADPRLPVHRRRVPRPRGLGPLAAVGRARVRAPRSAHGGRCSSTTTRCTPTTRSTGSGRAWRRALGGAGRRPRRRSSSPPSGARSRSARRRPPRPEPRLSRRRHERHGHARGPPRGAAVAIRRPGWIASRGSPSSGPSCAARRVEVVDDERQAPEPRRARRGPRPPGVPGGCSITSRIGPRRGGRTPGAARPPASAPRAGGAGRARPPRAPRSCGRGPG